MKLLNIVQIVVAILLIVIILLQRRSTGLGSAFGGESNVFASRRGIEKHLFLATIILGIIFVVLAILNILY